MSCQNNNKMNSFDIQGHRGCRGLLPENSIPAFLHAVELGVKTLELDVAISKDGHIIVSHDPWMSGTICSHPDGRPVSMDEERSIRIYEMSLSEIQKFDCGKRGHKGYTNQTPLGTYKPTLEEVVKAVEKNVAPGSSNIHYNIETKTRPEWDSVYTPLPQKFTRMLYNEITRLGITNRTIIQSFDPRTLEALKRIDKGVKTALLTSNHKGFEANMALLSFTPDIFSPNYLLTSQEEINQAKSSGMKVIPWTINAKEEMERFIQMGVDGIITDYPDILINLLKES